MDEKFALVEQISTDATGKAGPHVIMNGLNNAELNEIVITKDRDKTQTELAQQKFFELSKGYLTSNPFLKLAMTHNQSKGCKNGR